MKKSIRIVLIVTTFFLTSCATLFYNNSDLVSFNSTPSGATVYINGKNTGMQTPCQIHVKPIRKETIQSGYYKGKTYLRFNQQPLGARVGIDYEFKKENYAPAKSFFYGRSNGYIWFDLLFYPSLLVDAFSGCSIRYKRSFNENLTPLMTKDTVIKKEYVYINSSRKNEDYQFEKKSDIDNDIPALATSNPYRFALIIGNEDYSSHQKDLGSEINVDFARNDASAFKEYAVNLLNVPDKNVIFLLDATTGQLNQAISKMNLIIKATQGNAEVLVYYAGHGLPDEVTKEAYIMPVDVNGKNAADGINLKTMYSKLTEFPSKRITVFIDACFSGGARNQGLLAARGVKVKAKENELTGNVIVFSASSGEQSSLALKDKQHGMFTYYLLSKLKETKGDVSYNDLAKSIKDNVSLQSVMVNDKEQTPQVNVSGAVVNDWGSFNVR